MRPGVVERAVTAWRVPVMLAVALALVLVSALVGGGRPAEPAGAGETGRSRPVTEPVQAGAGPAFTLMQMNLCLSGLAGCHDYPAVVREATAAIRQSAPDAVTFNEACRRDVARIARRTGYRLSFARVIYRGEPLPCVRPGGRGLFGDAVLTRARVHRAQTRAFAAQRGLEERRWLCAVTRARLTVCTAHLGTRFSSHAASVNDAQCAELTRVLQRRAAERAVVFGGDVNRRRSCAPRRLWTRTDRSAARDRAPGSQHAYGSVGRLRSPTVEVVPSEHSDHDVLLVRARKTAASHQPRDRH